MKAEQGCAALPVKKAELQAGQAVDSRRNFQFPSAKLSLTLLMLAESSLCSSLHLAEDSSMALR